jgi:hypothetical protein
VFEGHHHVSLRALPGMAERTLRMGSAGKAFSFTAWKVGWVTGPAFLMAPVVKAHQFLVFTVASSLQRAVAYGLDEESGFYTCALACLVPACLAMRLRGPPLACATALPCLWGPPLPFKPALAVPVRPLPCL